MFPTHYNSFIPCFSYAPLLPSDLTWMMWLQRQLSLLNEQRGGGQTGQQSAAYLHPDYNQQMWTLMVIVCGFWRQKLRLTDLVSIFPLSLHSYYMAMSYNNDRNYAATLSLARLLIPCLLVNSVLKHSETQTKGHWCR